MYFLGVLKEKKRLKGVVLKSEGSREWVLKFEMKT